MLTSKQRAKLRSMANNFEVLYQVGKSGIVDTIVKQTEDALEARELIKLSVLENSPYTAREAADEIAAQLNADVVQVIGRKFVLGRRSKDPKKRVIELD